MSYEDIKPFHKLRGEIVHNGIIPEDLTPTECNRFSIQLENLVRNLIVDLLELKMDPNWKITWGYSAWSPELKKT